MPKLTGKWRTYIHSLVGLAIGMGIIFFTINLIKQRGPAFLQGPANTVGGIVGGSRFGL